MRSICLISTKIIGFSLCSITQKFVRESGVQGGVIETELPCMKLQLLLYAGCERLFARRHTTTQLSDVLVTSLDHIC